MTDNIFSDGKIDPNAKDVIKKTIETVEKLEDQKREILEKIKETFDEAKSFGLDVKILKDIIKLKRLSDEELQEKEYLIDIYKDAVGIGETKKN
jgi:uncharacterized protein (UPF0335 family)